MEMKKRALISVALLVNLIFAMSLIIAAENTSKNTSGNIQITPNSNEETKIDKAYECLENKVKDKCFSLSSEEKVFSSLAIGKCSDEVISDPKYKSNLKYTAQAILGLDKTAISTEDAEKWLLNQNTTPEDIVWYLQIESNEETSCTITYQPDGTKNSITIGEDKKISSNAGACLSLSEGNYWLRADPSCYEKEFEVSCNKGFQTNLLFRKKTSSTIYVSEKTTSASAEGTTTEKINSVCFSQSGSCTYEGSLWAAMILDFKGYDVSDYIPYLITMADENKNLLPNAFLYYLIGGDFRTQILLQQRESKYWDESGDKFYDTAVALFPFQDEDSTQKTNSKNWLLEVQDKEGCWQGNIRNTAFLLNSIWPRETISPVIDEDKDCEDLNFYCMSPINCKGNILGDYDCSGVLVCCDTKKILETCSEKNGKPCASGEICSGGDFVDSSDKGTNCCVGGNCQVQEQASECVSNGGECRSYGCNVDEESTTLYDCDFQDTCCVQKTTTPTSYWWIWLLAILIILIVIAIIFRNKIRPYWFRLKSKFSRGSPPPRSRGPGLPPPSSRIPMFRPSTRRILPPSQQQSQQRRVPQKPQGEIDNILKKLKEMGK